jgi:HK97 family phage major capsid protein
MFKLGFQNSKRRCARHRSIVKWGAIALLGLTVAAALWAAPHIPLADFTSVASIASVPMLGVMGLNTGLRFFDADKATGGGTAVEDPADHYEGKDDFEKAVLASAKKLEALQKAQDTELKVLKDAYVDLASKLLAFQKNQLLSTGKAVRAPARHGEVSEDCARHLGAIAYAIGLRRGNFSGASKDIAEQQAKEILGAEWRAALTTSDIPLPVEYSAQIVELVSQFGSARRYGTVFPLGAGSVKLPKLTTDPTFGLIAMSGTVTEKSPQIAFVTFNAEKFGGLVRMPTEIDQDSIVAMGAFLARYGARNIALVEDYNFWASTGGASGQNGTAKGLLQLVIDNSKVVQMASTKTHYSDVTLANCRAVRAVPDEAALYGAAYYMHPTFEQQLSSFNTSGDRPYNPQAQIQGYGTNPLTTGPTLDGFPIRWVNTLPVFSTSANVSKTFILFGDPSYQYLGTRGGIRFDTSMEAGFTTDEILVRALERFTVGLMANGAVAGIETAAS